MARDDSDLYLPLGDRIKELRRRLRQEKVGQKEFAQLAGLGFTTFANAEQNVPSTLETMRAIAAVFGCPWTELVSPRGIVSPGVPFRPNLFARFLAWELKCAPEVRPAG